MITEAAVAGAISGNSLILLGVMIVLVFAIAFGMLRKRGSGIDAHPGEHQSAPGSSGPSEEASADQGQSSATGSAHKGDRDSQHGTE